MEDIQTTDEETAGPLANAIALAIVGTGALLMGIGAHTVATSVAEGWRNRKARKAWKQSVAANKAASK